MEQELAWIDGREVNWSWAWSRVVPQRDFLGVTFGFAGR